MTEKKKQGKSSHYSGTNEMIFNMICAKYMYKKTTERILNILKDIYYKQEDINYFQ